MASTNYFFTIFLVLLTSFIFNVVAARPINIGKSFDDAMDISSLAAIKIGGGPSAGGEGHQFPTSDSNSRPSPGGKGHDKILGEMKNSGPSPGGKGHGFPDALSTLGNIKNHGTKGYDQFPNHESLIETTRSGPWVGDKVRTLPYSENFWNMKNSGPSPGGKGH